MTSAKSGTIFPLTLGLPSIERTRNLGSGTGLEGERACCLLRVEGRGRRPVRIDPRARSPSWHRFRYNSRREGWRRRKSASNSLLFGPTLLPDRSKWRKVMVVCSAGACKSAPITRATLPSSSRQLRMVNSLIPDFVTESHCTRGEISHCFSPSQLSRTSACSDEGGVVDCCSNEKRAV